ncbi:MAG: DNA phosphorothioation-associated protein 4 [Leptolyngbya sp. Prado105]|jgi:dnd system-associated protein 4|nr:DNA phosphorothioation-associated protein 4 [Leptolyngbya sp. Prado105]
MAIARIQISEDKAELVKALRDIDGTTGFFQTYAEVLAFAAMLGISRGRRVPLGKFSRKDPDPVPQDQFRMTGALIGLVASVSISDLKILLPNEECDAVRAQIFQEYANGGLEILQAELQGVVDYMEHILLMLNAERNKADAEEFDLSRFL